MSNYIKKYVLKAGFKIIGVENIDIGLSYPQWFPNRCIDSFFVDGQMHSSPHVEIANLFFTKGIKWVNRHYRQTKYYQMQLILNGRKNKLSPKYFDLCNSMRAGYLRRKLKGNYIIMLKKPFSMSRYGFNERENCVPEIWAGHHRVGILLALGIRVVKVLFAEDKLQNSKISNRKIDGFFKQ